MSQPAVFSPEFAPPQEPARKRALALAAAAHVLLFVALGLVTQWRTHDTVVAAEAELWSALPTAAAPAAIEPEPPTPPAPPAPPRPAPDPEVSKVDADIALKKQKAQDKKKKEQHKAQTEQERKDKLAKDKAEKKKKAQDKAEQDKARDKREPTKADKAKAEAAQAEALRKENLKRVQGLMGASGADTATGSAAKSSGPSAAYAGRLVARIKPKITYPGDIVGNPRAEVEVKVNAEGLILSRRITQSSGNKAWDDAVLRAIDKTEVLPKDSDGSIPPVIVLGFKPQD